MNLREEWAISMKITDLPAEKLWFLIGIIVGAAIHGPVTVMVGL